jgi:hypothetical protein
MPAPRFIHSGYFPNLAGHVPACACTCRGDTRGWPLRVPPSMARHAPRRPGHWLSSRAGRHPSAACAPGGDPVCVQMDTKKSTARGDVMGNDLDELEAGAYRPFDLWHDPELLRARSTALTELTGAQPPTRGVSPQREARWVRAQLEWLSTQHEGPRDGTPSHKSRVPPVDPPASRLRAAVES